MVVIVGVLGAVGGGGSAAACVVPSAYPAWMSPPAARAPWAEGWGGKPFGPPIWTASSGAVITFVPPPPAAATIWIANARDDAPAGRSAELTGTPPASSSVRTGRTRSERLNFGTRRHQVSAK